MIALQILEKLYKLDDMNCKYNDLMSKEDFLWYDLEIYELKGVCYIHYIRRVMLWLMSSQTIISLPLKVFTFKSGPTFITVKRCALSFLACEFNNTMIKLTTFRQII